MTLSDNVAFYSWKNYKNWSSSFWFIHYKHSKVQNFLRISPLHDISSGKRGTRWSYEVSRSLLIAAKFLTLYTCFVLSWDKVNFKRNVYFVLGIQVKWWCLLNKVNNKKKNRKYVQKPALSLKSGLFQAINIPFPLR